MLIIMGDMNAKVKNPTNDVEKQVIGSHSLIGNVRTEDIRDSKTQSRREKLIEFCLRNELKIENTMFPKPKISRRGVHVVILRVSMIMILTSECALFTVCVLYILLPACCCCCCC